MIPLTATADLLEALWTLATGAALAAWTLETRDRYRDRRVALATHDRFRNHRAEMLLTAKRHIRNGWAWVVMHGALFLLGLLALAAPPSPDPGLLTAAGLVRAALIGAALYSLFNALDARSGRRDMRALARERIAAETDVPTERDAT